MKVELKQLSIDMSEKEYNMLQDILDIENGFTNPAYKLSYEEYKNWLKREDDYSRGKNLPEGWVPCTTYFLYIDDAPVGYGRIRHYSNESLEKIKGVGNFGYGIAQKYRGSGYGNILFSELLKKCKDFGYTEIKLFPYKNNAATLKIMMKNGGKIIGDFNEEKHIVLIPIDLH
jgi:predicted acetyltransferase